MLRVEWQPSEGRMRNGGNGYHRYFIHFCGLQQDVYPGLKNKYLFSSFLQDLATPEAFSRNPSRVWEFFQYRRDMALNKEPNAAHLAIADCEARLRKQGRSVVVITQCIDDLHQKAGSKHVLRVHGETLTGSSSVSNKITNKQSLVFVD